MGFDAARAAAAIRLSLGSSTTQADIKAAAQALYLAASQAAQQLSSTST